MTKSDEKNKYFDYFNRDLDFLIILILLEHYHNQKNLFKFSGFLKGDYREIKEIAEEIMDTNDFGSIEDLILNQISRMGEELKFFKVKAKGIYDDNELLVKIIKKAMEYKGDDNVLSEPEYYCSIIDDIYGLKKIKEEQIKQYIDSGKKYGSEIFREIMIPPEKDNLSQIANIVPEHILLKVKFDDNKIPKIEKEIKDFIYKFSKDKFLDSKPSYKNNRLYFSQQIINFYNYINALPVVDNSVDISFDILKNENFEAIKILKYLELGGEIKIARWDDDNCLHIILKQNFSINKKDKTDKQDNNIRIEKARFKNGILYFQNKEIDFSRKQNQKDLLATLFKEPPKNWHYDEIQEDWGETEYPSGFWRKFYTAGDEINKTVAIETQIKDFIIKTTKQIKINTQYG